MSVFDGDRPQVSDLGDPEPLRVPGFVTQPSAGAPRPPEDDTLGQLANALGAFNTSVSNFGRYFQIDQRPHPQAQQKSDEQQLQQFQTTKTPAEQQAAFDNGSAPTLVSPVAQRKLAMIHGSFAGQELADDISQDVADGTVKWADGSAQALLEQRRAQILQQRGWTPDSGEAAGFGAVYNEIQSHASRQATAAVQQDMAADHSQGVNEAVELAVKAAYDQRLSPADAWAKIGDMRGQLLKGVYTTPSEIDDAAYSAIMRRSSEDPNWALAMGNQGRIDADGKTAVPSLFSKSSYMTAASNLALRAHAADMKAADDHAQDAVTDQIGTMLQQQPQNIALLPKQISYSDPSKGIAGQVDREKAVTAATNSMIARDNTRIATGQATPEQVQDEQLSVFARAGLRQNQWADTLNNAGKGGADMPTLTDPAKQGQALAAYQLYSSLRAKNPAYLQTLLSPEASRFFTAAYTQQTVLNRSPIEAMQAASQITAAPKNEAEANVLASQREQVDNAARSLDFGGGFLGFGKAQINNPYIASKALSEVAGGLVRLNGMAPADAVKAAAPIVQNHFVNVNGSLVPDLHYLPKEVMTAAATRYLHDWATGPAAPLHLDPSKVTIASSGEGQFIIVDSQSGMPIVAPRSRSNPQGGFSYVTSADLVRTGKILADEARDVQNGQLRTAAEGTARVMQLRRNRITNPAPDVAPFNPMIAPGSD